MSSEGSNAAQRASVAKIRFLTECLKSPKQANPRRQRLIASKLAEALFYEAGAKSCP